MRHHNLRRAVLALAVTGCDASTLPFAPPESALPDVSIAPGAYDLAAIARASNVIDLSWTDASSSESGYNIERSANGPEGPFALDSKVGPGVSAFSDGFLAATTTYCYRVAAYRLAGRTLKVSAPSTVACATTKLAPPSNAAAMATSSTEVKVTWTAGAGTAAGFRVERAGSMSGPWIPAATTSGTTTAFTDAGRTPDEQVCYRVIGFTATDETSPSNTACATLLAAPSNLVASTASDGIDLAWQDNSTLEAYYLVEGSSDGVNFGLFAVLGPNTTSYHLGPVTNATRLWFRVRASRDGQSSDASNTASATGGCAPTAEVCDNGSDDDCDGYTDFDDYDCSGLVDCNANECGSGTICSGGYCVSSCNDGFRDSDESDVDCGGGCGVCQVGRQCWGSYDCASNNCVYQQGASMGVCQPPVSPP
jgi:hypothetical protein